MILKVSLMKPCFLWFYDSTVSCSFKLLFSFQELLLSSTIPHTLPTFPVQMPFACSTLFSFSTIGVSEEERRKALFELGLVLLDSYFDRLQRSPPPLPILLWFPRASFILFSYIFYHVGFSWEHWSHSWKQNNVVQLVESPVDLKNAFYQTEIMGRTSNSHIVILSKVRSMFQFSRRQTGMHILA